MPAPKDPEKYALYIQRQVEAAKRRAARPGEQEARSQRAKEAWNRPGMRQKYVDAAIRRYENNPEYRIEYGNHMRQLYAETDLKQRVSEATKEAMQREDVRQGYVEGMERENVLEKLHHPDMQEKRTEGIRQAYTRPEYKQNLKASMDKVKLDPEYHKALSEGVKRAWANPEIRDRQLAAIAKGMKSSGTSIELAIEEILQASNIAYEHQKVIGDFIVDFYVPSKNLVIECDGDYWHNLPHIKEKDVRKNAFLTKQGFNLLRLPEHKIRKKDLAELYILLEREV